MANHALQSTSDPATTRSDGSPPPPNAVVSPEPRPTSAMLFSPAQQPLSSGLSGPADPLGLALLRLRTADPGHPQSAAFHGDDEQRDSDPNDRRQFPRHRSSYVVSVRPDGGSATTDLLQSQSTAAIRGEMIDLSLNGIAFKLLKPLQPDSQITVNLRNPVNGCNLRMSGLVIRCLPGDGQEWKVVCCFEHHLSVEQLAQFTKSASTSVP